MSDHADHAADDASHANTADAHAHHGGPTVPSVVNDEAPDSPKWLPWVGVGIVVAVAAFGIFMMNSARRGHVEVTSDSADIVVTPPSAAQPAAAPAQGARPSGH